MTGAARHVARAIVLLFGALCAAPCGAQVTLRGGERIEDPVVRIDAGGVEVGGARPRVIGWERVREVHGEHAQAAAAYAPLSDALWRADLRLRRGDLAMAEPLFERAFAAFYGARGPSPQLAAQGLLRCRLARGAHASAVEPWLETLRLRREHGAARAVGASDGADAIDPDTGLAPALPPVWLDTPALEALSRLGHVQTDDPVVGAFDAIYRWSAAATRDPGAPAPTISPAAAKDPGVQLARLVAEAQHGDASVRAAARGALRRDLQHDFGSWREAWRRVALGRSLLCEQDAASRAEGVLELLHVPARFGASSPHLSGVALALVCDELERTGDLAGAATLRAELEAISPSHPGLEWLDARRGGG